MPENDKRPEATHRQTAALSTVPVPDVFVGPDGRRYAYLSNSASDLIPSVQFGNVLVGPVTIARVVPVDPTPEEVAQFDAEIEGLIERSRKQQQAAEFVVGAERRIIQWAIDPATRVVNPATGAEVVPPAPPQTNGVEPAAQQAPVVPPPPPEARPATPEEAAAQVAAGTAPASFTQ